jgi:hypothetical protein
MAEYPYWNSYARTIMTASSHEIVTAYSFLYPVYIYNILGAKADSLTRPPHTFRIAPRLQTGALMGPGADERRDQWLASFDVIADMTIVSDSLLVIVHGTMSASRQTGIPIVHHERLDLYHLPTRARIAENVVVPEGTRMVVGTPDGLWFASAEPPWTLTEFRIDYNAMEAR